MSTTPAMTTRSSVRSIIGSILLSVEGVIIAFVGTGRRDKRGRGPAITGMGIGFLLLILGLSQGNAILHMNGK